MEISARLSSFRSYQGETLFRRKSLDSTPEQKAWDRRNRCIALIFLAAMVILGILSFGSAAWVAVSSVTPSLALNLNDMEEIDRAAKETARQGLSRLILITTAFIFFYCKINDALTIAYKNLGERPTANRSGSTTQSY